MLYGRDAEISAVDGLLRRVRTGGSGALVLRGEPGIGKTALLDLAAARGEGLRVIRRAGAGSERNLAFAGLHLLLSPLLDRLDALPQPQRHALSGALGLAPATGADRLLVGLAVLSLLGEAAEERPVLCLVDDAHWLDRPSMEALAFAARRLDADAVGLLVATRGDEEFPGLPELRLRGLSVPAAAALLEETARSGLTPARRYRVLTEARGNPLALIELPAALHDPGGTASTALPLTARLQAAFAGQVDHLPERSRLLLLVAAVADGLGEVLAAGARLGVGTADLPPAEEAGLITADERAVRFRHPLIREAVYQRAPVGLRLAVHGALAEVLSGDRDADRRAWHRAAATAGADERIAAELERTARRAAARLGSAAAAAAYRRAAELSEGSAERAGRLALAAEAATEAGDLDGADRLADEAGGDAADPALAARLAQVRATTAFSRGEYGAAHRLVISAADLSPERAPRALVQAVQTAWYLGHDALLEVWDRLRAAAPRADPQLRPVAELFLGVLTRLLDPDPGDAVPLADLTPVPGAPLRDYALACGAPLLIGADAHVLQQATRMQALCRAHGGIGVLPMLQFFQAQAELFQHGRHQDATATAEDALRTAEDTRQAQWAVLLRGLLAYTAAVEGDEHRCLRLSAEAARGGAVPMPGAHWLDWAQAVLDLGQGRVEAALVRLDALTRGPGWYHVSAMRCVPDLVEAAVRHGEPDRARPSFARYERWARASGQPLHQATTERCRALLATGQEAERHYLAALDITQPYAHARTELLYGEWLRRSRRKSTAAVHLTSALETLDRLGARPWSDRARIELQATGTRLPRRTRPGAHDDLTSQERHIVRLAAQGLSNKDIAAQLILSPRTVGHHLYKAYPKLGVASRAELAGLDL
ncbi:AAA family ATPase [Actinomadura sp. 21ATH]|uniref:helix-turn-helix transcriptional regulator n=1 Tax=Actinomadura sp. 21ATH TaxID=1735444 RepID=UPI0035C23ECF